MGYTKEQIEALMDIIETRNNASLLCHKKTYRWYMKFGDDIYDLNVSTKNAKPNIDSFANEICKNILNNRPKEVGYIWNYGMEGLFYYKWK